jgi:hypothetical protein
MFYVIDAASKLINDVDSVQQAYFYCVEERLAVFIYYKCATKVLDDTSEALQFSDIFHDLDDSVQVSYANKATEGRYDVNEQCQQESRPLEFLKKARPPE